MDLLRSIIKWISGHRVFSIFVAIILGGFVVGIRIVASRSAGTVSPPIERGSIVESVYGIGTVTAKSTYNVRPGVISTLNELYVKEGDSVKKGDALVKIDHVIYRAPFAGTIAFLPFKVGENVFPQLPVLSLVDLADRYLVVSLEQQGALRVKRGQKVKMSFDTIREQSYDGKIEAVYSFNGNFLARVDVSMLPIQVLPDMTADVAIEIERHDDVLLVPVAALEQGFVWLKRGHGIPQRVAVKTGIVDKEMAEILSGDVQPGDRVLIRTKSGG